MFSGVFLKKWDTEKNFTDCYDYEISFCKTGQKIYPMQKECVKLSSQQMLIHPRFMQTSQPCCMTGREEGISLFLNTVSAEIPLTDNFNISEMLGKFCNQKGYAVIMSEQISDVLTALMQPNISEQIRRIKVVELFLLLYQLPCSQIITPQICTCSELKLSLDIFTFAMAHMQEHFTIEELALKEKVSPTWLKKSFRNVYGQSLYACIRAEKMHRAARQLIVSKWRIIDIAENFGYENNSKFSSAFRDVFGVTPSAYRKENIKGR